ncbi:CoA ester lyase [Nocardioides carbamazepini]|uniref:HpcH/HpaI aldolase/citrate lyase family protein n=1 Tax=Nocardioides carbamazepini TaxID=2854259 RepID=UPI00214A4E78|nr:CoA ester lyase [Nocardioides carbamazepini]MCR1785834.1 CoA ester lyase [Nocardioides carbamazepini]
MSEHAAASWRSLLYVPSNRPRFVAGAVARRADAVILDLEDSVPQEQKAAARAGLPAAIETVAQGSGDVLVRVNRNWSDLVPDLAATVHPAVAAINLPKVDDPGVVRVVSEMLDELEAHRGLEPGHVRIFVRIETARGVRRIDDILGASERVVATAIGTGDLAIESRLAPDGDGIRQAFLEVTLAARAAGVRPLGLPGLIVDFSDIDAFRRLAEEARSLGSRGAPCIHPSQVPVLNEVFGLQHAEVEAAREVVAAFEEAAREGRGSLMHQGRFIDVANYKQACRTLEQAARQQERETA